MSLAAEGGGRMSLLDSSSSAELKLMEEEKES
jgi:hypothetical protein